MKLFMTNIVGNIHLFILFLFLGLKGKVKKAIAIARRPALRMGMVVHFSTREPSCGFEPGHMYRYCKWGLYTSLVSLEDIPKSISNINYIFRGNILCTGWELRAFSSLPR